MEMGKWKRFCSEVPAKSNQPIIVYFEFGRKLWYATYDIEGRRIHNLDPNAIEKHDREYFAPTQSANVWWSYLPSNESEEEEKVTKQFSGCFQIGAPKAGGVTISIYDDDGSTIICGKTEHIHLSEALLTDYMQPIEVEIEI